MTKTSDPLKRFWSILQPDKKDIVQIIWYALISGFVSLSLPLGIQAIINLIQGGKVSMAWIILILIVVIGVVFVGILRLMQMRITENIQQKIFTRSSFEFSYRFPKMTFNAMHNEYPPELANRFFDTLNIQKGVSKLVLDYSAALLQIIFSLILLSLYHPFFIVFGFLLFLLLFFIFRFSFESGLKTSLKESKYKYKVAHWLQEIARNTVTFKKNDHHEFALSKNDSLVSSYITARESHFKVLVKQFAQLIGFKAAITAALLLIGGLLVINQQMNIGQFVAAEIIILGVINSVEKLILGLETFYDVLTAIEKVGQVIDLELDADFAEKNIQIKKRDIRIELDNITYAFPGEKNPILNNITMVINPKEHIYIDGKNGSGKSTLLKILGGIVEPDSGFFYLNDNSFNKVKWLEYRCQIGIITSNQPTFEGTIIENITFNDPLIKNEELKEVIDALQLAEFLYNNPDGLDAHIHSEGRQIPSSIAQKIVLARTIINQPKLLILEDPLDKLDPEQTKNIIDYLTKPEQPWTLIVVSKNEYWKQKCSRTITLNKGVIIADTKNS